MTIAFHKGLYGVRLAETDADLMQCQALRHRCFFGSEGQDEDSFDTYCRHIMIAGSDGLVATFRVLNFDCDVKMDMSYTAQSYDIALVSKNSRNPMEVGRFCIAPDVVDPDVLRLCWGTLAQIVDVQNVDLLFGCTSFTGTDSTKYKDGFALLGQKYLAPQKLQPSEKSIEIIRFRDIVDAHKQQALSQIPPLLRSYLAMGGWVSDHAVIDRHLNTIHVFTGLEIAAIPASRAKALRSIMQSD